MTIDVGPSGFKQGIAVYPNPNEGVFKITMSDKSSEPMMITIFDNTQRVVLERTVIVEDDQITLDMDMTFERKGIYFVHFRRGDELVVQKMIIF